MISSIRLSNTAPASSIQKHMDVAVIVRGVHERTEALCESLVAAQVPPDRITVIHEYPFSAALRRGFEIGLDYALAWTMCVDADVLIRPTAVSDLLVAASTAGDMLFFLQGRILDKFIGGAWDGGPRIYRTSLLKTACREIPPEGKSLRPETYVHRQMETKGYRVIQLQTITGLHDYEQYYCDLLRKMIFRAHKSSSMVPYLLECCQANQAMDPDFRVANWGLLIGLTINSSFGDLDARTWQSQTNEILCGHGIQEKGPLAVKEYASYVESTIKEYVPSESYKAFVETFFSKTRMELPARPYTFKYIPWLTGKALGRIGRFLVEWATK